MVVALGPGRFYGSSLPRPRFYAEVKLNEDRVDPPVRVMDPLLSWANEAHWSMGGLSFKRHRLQGRIEGSIKKLRAQQERMHRNSPSIDRNPATKPRFSGHKPQSLASLRSDSSESESEEEVQKKAKDVSIVSSPSIGSAQKRKRVRRLGDEFDRIAEQQQMGKQSEAVESVASRTRSRRPDAEGLELGEEPTVAGKGSVERRKKEADGAKPRRTSPRKKQLI
ncbi:uncharacterized protein LOC103718696 [Phoenix dactylifera]|uniref:Uncharacterized protein LOC103718696 n=1 Tax=Phoenix dactylifera TaxID=42345 RepID=A0A8B7CT51_PHODC|nr:uncharacterized protein LOC103718696 [Phoenix dactylifera]